MFKFSIKKGLVKLKEKNYDWKITSVLESLTDNLNEDQLRVLLMTHGLKIDNHIMRLYFYENVGFRCINEKEELYGKIPLCNNIEKYMNQLYLESQREEYKDSWKIGDVMIFNMTMDGRGLVIGKLISYNKLSELCYCNFDGIIMTGDHKGERYDFLYDEDELIDMQIGDWSLMYPTDDQLKEYFPEVWKNKISGKFGL